MSAPDQVARLLAMVPLLQRDALTVDDVAAQFNCTPTQIMKDLETLWFCGPSAYESSFMDINIESLQADRSSVITLGNADYLARPMRLTRGEASALLVALQFLPEADAAADAIERTMAKIAAVSRDSIPQAEVLNNPGQDPLVAQIAAAIEADLAMDIGYYVPSRDQTTHRMVDPVALFERAGRTYLDGWCHLANQRRTFRLDRMASVEVTTQPRTGDDLSTSEGASGEFFHDWSADMATIELAPQAAWFVEYHPITSSENLPNGCVRAQLPLVNPAWLTQQMARLGGHGRIIEPVELADEVQQSARRAVAIYAELGASMGGVQSRTNEVS